MLETKPQPVERTARMAARPASRAASAGPAASALPRTAERPVPAPERARRGSTADARLSRSEARLLTMAISCTVIVCALLVVYLAAYAQVTVLGMGQARLRTELREKRLENETLRAKLAAARNPDRVAENAATLGMTRDYKRIDYIPLPRAEDAARVAREPASTDEFQDNPAMKTGGEAGLQVAKSGPTADQYKPTRND